MKRNREEGSVAWRVGEKEMKREGEGDTGCGTMMVAAAKVRGRRGENKKREEGKKWGGGGVKTLPSLRQVSVAVLGPRIGPKTHTNRENERERWGKGWGSEGASLGGFRGTSKKYAQNSCKMTLNATTCKYSPNSTLHHQTTHIELAIGAN